MLSLVVSALVAAAQPAVVPAAQDCQAALGPLYEGTDEAELPGRVDGAALGGRDALLALRRERGDALIVVHGGDFSGADFRGARLHNICFIETDLSGSDWRGAVADGVGFVRADLTGARLAGARLRRVLLRDATLADVEATGVNLSGGRFDGGPQGTIENLRLERADLAGFRFDCGITVGDSCPTDAVLSLRNADLSGAAIHSWWGEIDFTGARIDGTEVAFGQLEALRSADIAGPIRVRGGDTVVELSSSDHRALLPHLAMPDEAPRPSFDCARASSPAEQAICGEDGGRLRALDREVAALYRRAVSAAPATAATQQAWLRERDSCRGEGGAADPWCMEQAYERRRSALIAALGPPAWPEPGRHVLYVAPPVGFDEAFRATPLYRRLVPALIGAAWSRVVVRANDDGTIDARGFALGGNAHMCTLGGDRLAFDPATGWYSGPYGAVGDEPAEWRTRPMPVLLFWGEQAAVYMRGHSNYGAREGDPRISDYASCGARAGFLDMIRVPAAESEARALFEAYGEF